jgi:S1-C subfamily serine protease
VVGVLCGTGAATAGIGPGDVITAVNGRQVDSANALTALVNRYPPGSVLRVTWVAASGGTRLAPIRLSPAPAA